MDIIKHGKYHNNEFRMKCWHCGCVFDYAKNDKHDYCGITEEVYVNCPECNRWCDERKCKMKKPM